MGYSILTTSERTKIEREIKQKSKEIIKPQTSTNTTSTSSLSSNGNQTTIENSNINMKLNADKQSRLNMFLKSIDQALPSDKYNPKTISAVNILHLTQ
jgi:hypothetical protein